MSKSCLSERVLAGDHQDFHRRSASIRPHTVEQNALMSRDLRVGITPHGYRRLRTKVRRLRLEHVLVWEHHHEPIPEGHEIHHVNGDKLDNRIENLRLVTRLDHKRIHSGCLRFGSTWLKCCRRCRWYRDIATDFYFYPGRSGVMGICRRCVTEVAVENKQRRRAGQHDLERSFGRSQQERPTRERPHG